MKVVVVFRKVIFASVAMTVAVLFTVSSPAFATSGVPSAPVDLSASGQRADVPQVSVDSTGLATAVWRRYDGSNYIIQSSTSQSGGTWSKAVDVSAAGGYAFGPQVSVDSTGLAIAVWNRFDGSNYIIQSSTSQSGGTWSTPVDLSASGQSAQVPQVSVDSTGLATAVWYRYDGSNDIIQSSTSQSGGIWSAPVDLSASGQGAYSPQVSVDSTGLATAVWARSDGSDYVIQSSTSQSGGAWSTPVDLTASGQTAFGQQVSVDSTGLATAVWYRSDGSKNRIQSSTSQSGGIWSTPVDLSAGGQSAYDPQVSVDSTGLAIAVWNRFDGSNDIIQSSTSQSGGTWSAPVNLSASGGNAYGQQVSVDSTGLATAVWFRFDASGDSIIQSSTIDNPIPSAPASAPTPELAKTGTNLHGSGVLAVGAAAVLLLGVGGTLLTRRTKNLK
jgi:hypothetical protein